MATTSAASLASKKARPRGRKRRRTGGASRYLAKSRSGALKAPPLPRTRLRAGPLGGYVARGVGYARWLLCVLLELVAKASCSSLEHDEEVLLWKKRFWEVVFCQGFLVENR